MSRSLTQMTSWVESWFYNPGCIDAPDRKRKWCLCAAVELIRDSMYYPQSKSDRRITHEILTYLLLGWNPITTWPDPSEYDEPDESLIDNWDDAQESLKGLLNFEDEYTKTNLYTLVTCLLRTCETVGSRTSDLFTGERMTVMMLALWLLDRDTSNSKDVFVIRTCLDLYYRHKATAPGLVDHEYASTSSELKYCSWIKDQIDRMLKMNIPSDEFKRNVAYLGWFASLVRANRIVASCNRCDAWKSELAVALEKEVELMLDTLRNRPLKFVDEVRDGSTLTFRARLFKLFRLRPQPVKIK